MLRYRKYNIFYFRPNKWFGLDEKMSVSDVYTNIDTDELFDF